MGIDLRVKIQTKYIFLIAILAVASTLLLTNFGPLSIGGDNYVSPYTGSYLGMDIVNGSIEATYDENPETFVEFDGTGTLLWSFSELVNIKGFRLTAENVEISSVILQEQELNLSDIFVAKETKDYNLDNTFYSVEVVRIEFVDIGKVFDISFLSVMESEPILADETNDFSLFYIGVILAAIIVVGFLFWRRRI